MTSLPEGTADEELEKEAEWIFRHGFTKATVSKQDGFTEDECSDWTRKEDTVVEKIKKALDFMRQQFLEVNKAFRMWSTGEVLVSQKYKYAQFPAAWKQMTK